MAARYETQTQQNKPKMHLQWLGVEATSRKWLHGVYWSVCKYFWSTVTAWELWLPTANTEHACYRPTHVSSVWWVQYALILYMYKMCIDLADGYMREHVNVHAVWNVCTIHGFWSKLGRFVDVSDTTLTFERLRSKTPSMMDTSLLASSLMWSL